MKKFIIVSFFLLLVFTRQTFGFDTTELIPADIASSNLHLEEASITSANKVAIVDKSGLHYSDPIAAMMDIPTWCGVPAEANRCLIRIMPGIYDLGTDRLYMSSYVDIEGSGENATKIEGRNHDSVIRLRGNSELRFLTVEHTGGEERSVAVSGDDSPGPKKLTNMTLISSKGTAVNYGFFYNMGNWGFSTGPLIIRNVTVIASGGTESVAIQDEYGHCSINIYRSFLKGDKKSIHNRIGQIKVKDTVLSGRVGGLGLTTCSRVYDKNYNFYADTCP